MPVVGRRSAEPEEASLRWLDRVSPYRGGRCVGLFQFKCAAVECHHFSNAADFDLADVCAVT